MRCGGPSATSALPAEPMRIGAIVQARMGSTRLPGKVARELPWAGGVTVLAQVLRRLARARRVQAVVVATTPAPADDLLVRIAGAEGAAAFRGPEEDVLARYAQAAESQALDLVVRVTSDCPCLDPGVVDLLIDQHLAGGADYTSNTIVRTFPHGLDAEVFSRAALERAHREAVAPHEREHVTPYLYRSGRFAVRQLEAPEALRGPEIRVTLDTPEDYALLCAVFDALYPADPFFGGAAIVELFRRKRWLREIYARFAQKRVCADGVEEFEVALRLLELQDV
jgi:spore coat polysaccharide biosynthesis protein SpsF